MTPPAATLAYSNPSQSPCRSTPPTRRFQNRGPLPPPPPWISTGASASKMMIGSSTGQSSLARSSSSCGEDASPCQQRLQWTASQKSPSKTKGALGELDKRLRTGDISGVNQPLDSVGGSAVGMDVLASLLTRR